MLTHPRGGYLSQKLFVPKEAWSVKNVKLKAIEEKIANCDVLFAALGKFRSVDMLDADAVLEEMQSLEGVLDTVQSTLTKKLSSDVGVHGAATLFKEAPPPLSKTQSGEVGENFQHKSAGAAFQRSNSSNKSFASSWRKLRSKSSGVTGHGFMIRSGGGSSNSSNYAHSTTAPEREVLMLTSVPMTSLPNIQFGRKQRRAYTAEDGKKIVAGCTGPNKEYMSALVRLCSAVQVLGKIYFLLHTV